MGKSWKAPHKAAEAARKGAMFTKSAREIAVAARLGGPDPASNSRLKVAITAAKEISCPKDTIERAIKKGSGQLDGEAAIEELTYEGHGPHGVGIIVECQTNNRNRTASEIRNIFKSHNGNLGASGAVAWMFDRVALVTGKKANVGDPEEDAIEVGANEVEKGDEADIYNFYGAPEDTDTIRNNLQKMGWEITAAELSYKPKNMTELNDEQKKEVRELMEELDDNEDSHRLYATIS